MSHPCWVHISATVLCWSWARSKRSGNSSCNDLVPIHLSFQNLVLTPLCTLIIECFLRKGQKALMDLHKLTPYGVVTSLDTQQSSSPYLLFMTVPHRVWGSCAYLHSHLIFKTLDGWCFRFLMPSPPCFLLLIIPFHLTRWKALFSLFPCHKKDLQILSSLWTTPEGIGKSDSIGSVSKTAFTSVRLPPKDKYWDFHVVKFFLTLFQSRVPYPFGFWLCSQGHTQVDSGEPSHFTSQYHG